MSELSSTVEAVLRAAKKQLQGSDDEVVTRTADSVTTLLAAGEDVVAYETLCANLCEDDIVVERELLSSLKVAAQRAGADVALVEILLS